MKVKIIKTESEYKSACEKIYKLMHSTDKDIKPGTPEGDELELLSLLAERYEMQHYAMGSPDPVEAIKFRMDQMNLKQSDIAILFGGKTRVSEVLNRKRPLTLKMITLLNRYLGIPLESMIAGCKSFRLEAQKRKTILKNPSIKEYFDRSSSNIALANGS